MQPNTSDKQFSEQILQRVAADARRALARGHFCRERSRIDRLRCIDDQAETESQFGRQLWYFEGTAVDPADHRTGVFGALEYSVQFGLHELVEDGVFEAAAQRDRFRSLYHRIAPANRWQRPLRWGMAAALVAFAVVLVAHHMVRLLAP